MFALLRNRSIKRHRQAMYRRAGLLAFFVVCVALAGCTMVLQNDVRLGRLTDSPLKPSMSRIVYGIDASGGPLRVDLRREEGSDPSPDRFCGLASAQSPTGSTATSYFVFDAPPGVYFENRASPAVPVRREFVVPPGKQVFLGVFTLAPAKKWAPPFDYDIEEARDIVLSRDLEAAKPALGEGATELQLAEMNTSSHRYTVGLCQTD